MSSADTNAADADAADDEAVVTPTDEAREALLEEFRAELGDALVEHHIRPGDDLWLRITREAWRNFAEVAQRKLRFDFFDFLSAIDWLPSPYGRDMDAQEDVALGGEEDSGPATIEQGYAGGETRFQLLARLYSIPRLLGVHVKADLPDDDLSVDTWTGIYGGANWHERETHEMFGIHFVGHPLLMNLYLPTDFEGHPLRKDFPLLARRVKPWPGIVDVEQMPTSDDEEEEGADGGDGGAGDSGEGGGA